MNDGRKVWRTGAFAGVASIALAACGGGGGVASTPTPRPAPSPSPAPTPTPTPTPTPVPAPSPSPSPSSGPSIVPKSQQPVRSPQDDAEYRRNYTAFEYINELYALDHGWTGQGVTVGVIDDGVKANTELAGKISPLSKDFGTITQNGTTRMRNVVGDSDSTHGTLVGSVIAARNDGFGVQGVAPDATLVAMRVNDQNLDTTNADEKDTFSDDKIVQAIAYSGQIGLKVVNISLAKDDASQADPYWANAVRDFAAKGGLVVNSAGNESGANPQNYLDLNAGNAAGWLFVVALDPNGTSYQLTDYSNKCGQSMDRCVAAMGTSVTMDVNNTLVYFSGTSNAAPQVTGLAALILSKWPQLSGTDVGHVILNTARDIGAPGVDSTFGHGLIDVQAALSPVNPTLSNGAAASAVSSSVMAVPAALAGSSQTAAIRSALASVTVLDAYGRDFSGDLSGLVVTPTADRGWMQRRIEAGQTLRSSSIELPGFTASAAYVQHRIGPGDDQVRTALGYGAMDVKLDAKTHLSARFNGSDGLTDEAMGLAPSSDVAMAYAPAANMTVGMERQTRAGRLGLAVLSGSDAAGSAQGLQVSIAGKPGKLKLGWVDERGTLFGSPTGTGALRYGDGAQTLYAEASRSFALGGWSLDAYASLARTRLAIGGDMLITGASPIVSERFGVTAGRPLAGGMLRVGLAQPLTVIAGKGTLTTATGYDLAARSLVYDSRSFDMRGKAFDPVVTLGYERARGPSAFSMGLASRTDASELRALASWRLSLP